VKREILDTQRHYANPLYYLVYFIPKERGNQMFDLMKRGILLFTCSALLIACGTKRKPLPQEAEEESGQEFVVEDCTENLADPADSMQLPENAKEVKPSELPDGNYAYAGTTLFVSRNDARILVVDAEENGEFSLNPLCISNTDEAPRLQAEFKVLAGLSKAGKALPQLTDKYFSLALEDGKLTMYSPPGKGSKSIHKSVVEIYRSQDLPVVIHALGDGLFEIRTRKMVDGYAVSFTTRLKHNPAP
jgi:hypothetical protein